VYTFPMSVANIVVVIWFSGFLCFHLQLSSVLHFHLLIRWIEISVAKFGFGVCSSRSNEVA